MRRGETREQRLLYALVLMVRQYLDESDGVADSLSMSAGEHAIEALAEYGLMEVEGHGRLGRWTKAGNDLSD
jgi:hypothetical protein